MKPISINSEDKILIVAPHPDDECIGLGGLLAIYGNQCDVWVITDGSGCKMDMEKSEIIKIRSDEFIKAMKFCRVNNFRFWKIEDRCLFCQLDIFQNADVGQFTKIFVPSNNETHIDHISAYYAVMNMLKNQNLEDKEIYCYEITSPLQGFNCFLDISDVIDQKKQCIELYRSQTRIYDYSCAAISLNSFRACMMGLYHSYVEVYHLIDQTSYCDGYKGNTYKIEMERDKKIIHLLSKWISIKSMDICLEHYFRKININTVSIYGFGILGQLLYETLANTSVTIVCVIDKKFTEESDKFLSPNRRLPESDAVILTILFEYNSVRQKLFDMGYRNILLLEDVIENVKGDKNDMV